MWLAVSRGCGSAVRVLCVCFRREFGLEFPSSLFVLDFLNHSGFIAETQKLSTSCLWLVYMMGEWAFSWRRYLKALPTVWSQSTATWKMNSLTLLTLLCWFVHVSLSLKCLQVPGILTLFLWIATCSEVPEGTLFPPGDLHTQGCPVASWEVGPWPSRGASSLNQRPWRDGGSLPCPPQARGLWGPCSG